MTVAVCVNCARYPWKPEVDPAYLPAIRCHPLMEPKRWTAEAHKKVHDCPMYLPRTTEEAVPGAAPVPPTPVEIPETPPKDPPAASAENAEGQGGPTAGEPEGEPVLWPSDSDLETLKYQDLKALAKRLGLDPAGKGDELRERIRAARDAAQQK